MSSPFVMDCTWSTDQVDSTLVFLVVVLGKDGIEMNMLSGIKNIKREKRLFSRLKEKFSDIEVQVGGQTGLDLAPKGNNKSMILSDFSTLDKLHFFGDMMEEGENDYPLAKLVKGYGGYTVPRKKVEGNPNYFKGVSRPRSWKEVV